ncbi:MAG: alanine dehydrogenase [Crocinitomicaceae bacterium]|nr:alanine dehydrogenase [Crocinitomicaceae bacterium]
MTFTSEHPLLLGVIREGKSPPDQRVALTPDQCVLIEERFPQLKIVIQSSPVRRIRDAEYSAVGLNVRADVSDCDVLIGVKEVNIEDLVPGKTYLFFSHTHKLQPYNAKLLAAILDKKIRLIDYELLKRPSGHRIIGFGRWAGLVGAYSGLRALGLRSDSFELPKAIDCRDLEEMILQLKNVSLPANFKIVLTGTGRVGRGAREVLEHMKLRSVHPDDFLRMDFPEPVFTHLDVEDYNARTDGGQFIMADFIKDPLEFRSTFPRFAQVANLFIAGHFWAEGSPFLFTREDMRHPNWKVKVVADISCDIDGPVACTLRPSTIENPIYGYHPITEQECSFDHREGITVLAVDNLPCELPRDASEGFGRELMEHVIPLLVTGDVEGVLDGASQTTLDGTLNAPFAYLEDYALSGQTGDSI